MKISFYQLLGGIAVAGLLLQGCAALGTDSAAGLVSSRGGSVPVVAKVVGTEVIQTSVDKSAEGLIISAQLVSASLPDAWGATTTATIGGKAFSNNSGVWTQTDAAAGETPKVISASMTDANASWYVDQIVPGLYKIGTSTDPTIRALASDSIPGWATQLTAAQAFLTRKILSGNEVSQLTKAGGTWHLGLVDTKVADTWPFDVYLDRWLAAYKAVGSTEQTTDGTAGATSE